MTNFGQKARACSLFALLIFFTASITFGQAVTGTILGRVTDSTGAVLAGATIQIQNGDTGFSRTEQTDSAGRYQSRNLPLGSYSITAQQTGFRTEEHRGISLSVASEVTVNIELAVGNVQERVEVTAEAPAIETTNATVSALVSGEQIRDLPLNGRSVEQLALLTPGVTQDFNARGSAGIGLATQMSVNGSRVGAVLFLLDGTVVNDQSGGGPGSAGRNMLGVEAVLEFRMLTSNWSAEYGRVAGGVMSQVTRSGTNQFHGSAYEFLRNNIVDARNFFNPGELPPYRRNQFGASLGGRLVKDRIFFFGNYEGLRTRQGITLNAPVPDLNARQGLLPCSAAPTSTCNQATNLAQVTLNQAMVPFINLYPTPNGQSYGDGTAQYRTDFSKPYDENYYMGRMDFRLSDKDSLYVREVYNPSSILLPRPLGTGATSTATGTNFAVLSETHVFSSTSLNEFRVAYNRTNPSGDDVYLTPVPAGVTLIPGSTMGRIQFAASMGALGQLAEIGAESSGSRLLVQNLFQESESFSTVRGAHSLKFGVDVQRVQLNVDINSLGAKGVAQFGGLQALLAGTPNTFTGTVIGPNTHFERGFRRTIFGWFVQDDFRVSPRLTLNLGVRQDLFTSPTEVNGFIGNLRLVTDKTPTPGQPYHSPKNTLAPRVGLAWDPTGSGKTSVRVGVGLYYSPLDGRGYDTAVFGNPLFLQGGFSIRNPVPFPYPLANIGSLAQPTIAAAGIDYNLKNPTTVQYNLDVQRQLTGTLSLRLGYVGSRGRNQSRAIQADTIIPTIQADGSKLFPTGGTLTNPNFSSIVYTLTDGRYNYNGLQATLQKRLSIGLTFQANYTWSKAMSNTDQNVASTATSTPFTTLDKDNLNRDYSLSAYDQRQTVRLNSAYKMPWDKRFNGAVGKILGGWAINGIYTYGSGLPITMLDGFNNSRDGNTNNPDRPNLIAGASQNPISGVTAGCPGIPAGQKLGTADRWYDPCSFVLSPAGTYGNLGRFTVTLPGLNNINFTLLKNTALTEGMRLEFRWEIYNLFNHAQFSLPSQTVFTSARTYNGTAGVISSTTIDNRDMQFGLKLIF